MLQIDRATDALPVVSLLSPVVSSSAVSSLTPADFQDVAYNSVLLLPVLLASSITEHPCYADGCEGGFESYFESMYDNDECDNEVFVNHFYARAELCSFVAECVLPETNSRMRALLDSRESWHHRFPRRVGFALGWLSALALTDRPLALVGVQVLLTLVAHLQGSATC